MNSTAGSTWLVPPRFLLGRHLAITVLLLAALFAPPLLAEADPSGDPETDLSATLPEGFLAGPAIARLGDIAEIDIPEGFAFADGDTTRGLMQAMGNTSDGSEVGLIMPAAEEQTWFLVFEHRPVGFVRDDDGDKIDADALFESISQGTEAANEYRRENGIAELEVLDWQIAPHYDEADHNLVWALEAVSKESTGDEHISNYNVRLLGRRGYMSVTLVTDADSLTEHRPLVERMMAGFRYRDGHRYADFVKGDKLAGYGLTALVAGAAGAVAVKAGLFAVLAKFFAKAWKLLVLGAVAVGSALKRLFGGRGATTTGSPQA